MKRRILHINGRFHREGGAETCLRDLRKVQTEGKHDVFTLHGSTLPASYAPQHNESFTGTTRGGIVASLTGFQDTINRIREIAPDIIHLHVVHYDISPFLLRRIVRSYPTVYTAHDIHWLCHRPLGTASLETTSFESAFCRACVDLKFHPRIQLSEPRAMLYDMARRWVRHTLGSVTKTLAHNAAVRKVLVKNGFPTNQIEVLRPYVPVLKRWEKDLCSEEAAPPLRDSAGNILFVGGLTYAKGVFDLVEALAGLNRLDWRLVIVGDGEKKTKLHRSIGEKGLEARVDLVGSVEREHLGAYYRQADLLVMPSRCPETFGLAGLEAMLFGKPVVACENGLPYEWLVDGRTGFRVASGDIPGLREKIQIGLTDRVLAVRMGTAGREQAGRFRHRQEYVQRLMQIYEQAISEFHHVR